MRLLTHNMLTSHIKGVKNGYPLRIEDTCIHTWDVTVTSHDFIISNTIHPINPLFFMALDVVVNEVDFNPDFISRMIPRLEWSAVVQAAKELGKGEGLPEEVVPDYESNEEFLKKAHHILLEVEVQKGFLVCPETSRKFPVENGIPNMLLNEDEV